MVEPVYEIRWSACKDTTSSSGGGSSSFSSEGFKGNSPIKGSSGSRWRSIGCNGNGSYSCWSRSSGRGVMRKSARVEEENNTAWMHDKMTNCR